jgi:hypothetical protein
VFKLAYTVAGQLVTHGDIELILRPYKSKRSLDQNARYWAILREIAAVVWVDGKQFSDEAWHEHFKRTFIGCDDLPGGGTVGISTTTLTVAEFADYMTRIEQWCAEQGFPVMAVAA